MALPTLLSSLTTREAIQDTLSRCVLGLDTPNPALFDSAFTPDAIFNIDGRIQTGFDTIKSNLYTTVSKMDTSHILSNIRIDVQEGASAARVSASALAQHCRPGEGLKPGTTRFLAGCLYELEMVRDKIDGLWKIKLWKDRVVWTDGDIGIMLGS